MKISKRDFSDLKCNLHLCAKRFEVLMAKRTEQSRATRGLVCNYLRQKKLERAKIHTEQIIRDDCYVDALELLKTFHELLTANMNMIRDVNSLEPSLQEVIATIIWASVILQVEIPEYKAIIHIFGKMFPEQYIMDCQTGRSEAISPRVKQNLNLIPGYNMIEVYLIEIARSYDIPYSPDRNIISTLKASTASTSPRSPQASSSTNSTIQTIQDASSCMKAPIDESD